MKKIPKEKYGNSRIHNGEVLRVGKKVYYNSTIANMWLKVPDEIRRKIYDETEEDYDEGKKDG